MPININHVSKTFSGSERETLHDIHLDIADGEFICIVGPSGCGKSTLLNIVAGLETATEGTVEVDGKPITGPGADRMVMFQEAALYPWLNVLDNVKLGMRFARVSKEEQQERAERYLKMVQLYDFRHYPVHQLSGGMKQRTALARSLALDSKVLLMDEPFSALDKQTINILRQELEDIWLKTKRTILFVTHSVEEAVFFADRVVVLSENPGQIQKIYSIDVGRPRQIDEEHFINLRHEILQEVRREVEKFAQKEYDK